MSHYIYDGIVEVANLGPEFDVSANPIVLKLDPTISKLPSGALKANVVSSLSGSTLTLNGTPINLGPAIKAGETLTAMAYDPALKKISYTAENGAVAVIDLSSLASDIYITGTTYDAATMVLTLTDNSATTPDITLNLAELKKVATSNTGSVSFTGTGEASSPLVANVTSIPAGVPIPAASLTGVVPAAVMTSSTTNVLAVTGPNLVSTVNGVASSVPMASIVPATTNTLAITKAGGAVSTVNGVVGTQAIPVGTVVETLGYNAAGQPVYQAMPLPADNWRTIAGGLLPDGTTDTTEAIVHGGNVRVGPGSATATNVPLQVIAAGASALNPVNPTATFTGNTSKVYFESLSSPAGARVMVIEADTGKTRFNSASDDAQAWVKKDIITMDHLTGNLTFSGYPNSRNDAGLPENMLTTDAFGNVQSHPYKAVYAPSSSIPPGGVLSGQIPEDAQVFNMYDAGEYQGVLTLPVPNVNSEPLTILSHATFPYTVATTNQVAGGTVINGVKGVPLTFYPVVGQGWVFDKPTATTNVLTTVLAGPGPAAQSGAGNITSTVNGVISTAPSPATVVVKRFATIYGGGNNPIPGWTQNLGGGNNLTYTNLVVANAAQQITLPPIAQYPVNEELYIKAFGAWTGNVVVDSPALIDGLANFTIAKTSVTRHPSITLMHNGTTWYVV